MSVATELQRIIDAKADLKTAIENKGVIVSSDALIDDYPALVDSIPSGGGTLQSKEIYSTDCLQPITITPSTGYDGISSIQILPLPTDFEGTEIYGDFKLFYVDSTGDSDITFYDRELNEITIQTGDNPAFYVVNDEGTKPKYYFYLSELGYFENPIFYWTNKVNGAFNYHYYKLGDTSSFGTGNYTSHYLWNFCHGQTTETDTPFIWQQDVAQALNNLYWNASIFVGSIAENQALKDFLVANPSLNNPFTDNTVWSSSEISGGLAYAFVNGTQTQTTKSETGLIIPMFCI